MTTKWEPEGYRCLVCGHYYNDTRTRTCPKCRAKIPYEEKYYKDVYGGKK